MNQVLTEPRSAPATELTGNPYVGFRPFTQADGQLFFGREHETRELVSLLNAERLVLLFSPSGAGKTSLIQARLIPALERQRFEVLPVIRLNRVPSITDSTCAHHSNRYVDSVLSCLELTVPGRRVTGRISADDMRVEPAEPSLSECLDLRTRQPDRKAEFLIFDQFEEVFTLDPTDVAAKHEFFKQLGAALRGREDRDVQPDADAPPRSPRWALFAIREEYLGALEPYLPFLPSRLTTSLHLRYLDERRALVAIREPARLAGVEIDEEAARWLFASLARRWALPPGGSEPQLVEGSCVEAMQLQVVCRRLWDHLPPGQQRVTLEDIERQDTGLGLDQVDAALHDYYQDAVKRVAAEFSTLRERALRKWIDRQLITRHGLRGQVLLEANQTQGLPNAVIDALEATGLIRREERNGGSWVELAHDRLIRPINMNNDAWYKRRLSLLQVSAQAWDDASQPTSVLLHGRALEEAETWAAKHPEELSDIDRKFLAQSTGEREQRRREQSLKRWSGVALAALLIVVILSWLLVKKSQLNKKIDANYWAARAQVEWKRDPDAALFLAQRAYERYPYVSDTNSAVHDVLVDLLSQSNGHPLVGHQGPISQVGRAGDWLISASHDNTARLWLPKGSQGWTPDSHPVVLEGHEKSILYFEVNEEKTLLATASVDRTVCVWDLAAARSDKATGSTIGPRWRLGNPEAGPKNTVVRVAFFNDHEGKEWVCAAGQERDTYFWRLDNAAAVGAPPYVAAEAHQGRVGCIFYDPKNRHRVLATGSDDGTVRLWQLDKVTAAFASRKPGDKLPAKDLSRRIKAHEKSVTDVEFCYQNLPDGQEGQEAVWLLTASVDKSIRTWDMQAILASDLEIGPAEATNVLEGHQSPVVDIGVNPKTRILVSGGRDGNAYIWPLDAILARSHVPRSESVRTGEGDVFPGRYTLSGHQNEITDIATSPDGRWVATASADNTFRLWEVPWSEETKSLRHDPRDSSRDFTVRLPNRVGTIAFFTQPGTTDWRILTGSHDEIVRWWTQDDLEWETKHLHIDHPAERAKAVAATAGSAGDAPKPEEPRQKTLDALSNEELAGLCREILSFHWGRDVLDERTEDEWEPARN